MFSTRIPTSRLPLLFLSPHPLLNAFSSICRPHTSLLKFTPTTTTTTPLPHPHPHHHRITTSTMASQPQPQPQPREIEQKEEIDPLVQYVVVRRDLLDKWPTGSVIAQAVHASVAAIWESKTSNNTIDYCEQPGSGMNSQMHTVVLEAKNEAAVVKLADQLTKDGLQFALWTEQPENMVTALAAQPYKRSNIKKHFSKFRLFK